MGTSSQNTNDQAKNWNGSAGHAWVEMQDVLERMYQPFEELLAAKAGAGPEWRVLDVGCGIGSTTLAVARRLGHTGRCVGIDISEPMLAAARSRAEREGVAASFLHADAETYAFEAGVFDSVISRFGVMFFGNPVRAFENLRRAAKGAATMTFIAWRSAAENPFMTTAERAASTLLPNLPARRPDAPGQFAFADQQKVRAILQESGWTEVEIKPLDLECAFPEAELTRYVGRLGPVGLALAEADDDTRARVIAAIRPAFDPYVNGAEVRFNAACWMVSARA